MKRKYIAAHMAAAHVYSQLSKAQRLKVGSLLVKNNNPIAVGYNGLPSGWDDDQTELPDGDGGLITNPAVRHAEINVLKKLHRMNESADGAILFVTHAPCLPCSIDIADAGIVAVVYRSAYRSTDGIQYLLKRGVRVFHDVGVEDRLMEHTVVGLLPVDGDIPG